MGNVRMDSHGLSRHCTVKVVYRAFHCMASICKQLQHSFDITSIQARYYSHSTGSPCEWTDRFAYRILIYPQNVEVSLTGRWGRGLPPPPPPTLVIDNVWHQPSPFFTVASRVYHGTVYSATYVRDQTRHL